MKTLIIYHNPWIYAQELAVCKVLGLLPADICPNPYYAKNNEFIKKITRLTKDIRYRGTDKVLSKDATYDVIVRPTPMPDSAFEELHIKYPNATYIFVEEGMSCYMNTFDQLPLNEKEKTAIKTGRVYLSNPSFADPFFKERKDSLYSIPMHLVYGDLINILADDMDKMPVYADRVVFTEPYVQDYGDHNYADRLENLLETYSGTTILKCHPRDDCQYHVPDNCFVCNRDIPGQILFTKYPEAEFVYTGTSTISLFAPNLAKESWSFLKSNEKDIL